MLRRVLRPHQKEALNYCMGVQHPALFMEMRLGKTLVTIRALKLYESRRILVVGPYSTFFGWWNELELERETSLGLTILEGTKEERTVKLMQGWERGDKWFILNKEGHLVINEVKDLPWDGVVLDESTCIKAQGTKISEFFMNNFRSADHRFVLTGTPAPEGELDYFQQMQFLDEDIFKEKDIWQFKKNNFGFLDYKLLISPQGSRYIPQRLAKYCFFQTRRECKLGGLKIYERRYVDFTPKAQEAYNEMAKKFLLEYEGKIRDSTVYSITKHTWMKQLCGGFIEDDFVFDGKLQEILYLLKTELKGEQVIIWARHTAEIIMLSEKLEESGFKCGTIYGKVSQSDRRMIAKAFQGDQFQLLILQPECWKFGTTLSSSSVMIYYSSPEGLETRLQTEDRPIDVATTDSILIIDIAVRNTVDEDNIESLIRKEGTQEMMRRMVKRIQEQQK